MSDERREEFRHNARDERFELWINGELVGEADYTVIGQVAEFDHTEVDPALNGQGLASRLVTYAMDTVRAEGQWKVRPVCSYVAIWFRRHPDYADLLAS